MKAKLLVAPLLVAVLGVGYIVYSLNLSPPASPPTTTAVSTAVSTVVSAPSGANDYLCAKPAINTFNFCDTLPAGYTIAARLTNAPGAYCPTGFADSACKLLKQTQTNGVCDPNETPWSSPLDCACTGATAADPYTGRCAAPAAICQLQPMLNPYQQP